MKGADYSYHLFLMPSIEFDVSFLLRRAEIHQVKILVFLWVLNFRHMDVANKEIIGFGDQLRASIKGNGKRILKSTYRHLENYLALELMSYVVKLLLQSLRQQFLLC